MTPEGEEHLEAEAARWAQFSGAVSSVLGNAAG
jgi:hypothetical protein